MKEKTITINGKETAMLYAVNGTDSEAFKTLGEEQKKGRSTKGVGGRGKEAV